jgi:hypothetical protein
VDVGSSFPGHLRTLANPLLTDGVNLNQELVNKGWCWWYRKYAPTDAELEKLEKEARDAKKGLSDALQIVLVTMGQACQFLDRMFTEGRIPLLAPLRL